MKKLMILAAALLLLLAGCGDRSGEKSSPASDRDPPAQGESALTSQAQPSEASAAPKPLTAKLIVPEGYTLPRIGMTLEEMEICTAEEFVAAAQAGEYPQFSLLLEQPEDPFRCFALEGYLFPDTYEIYTDDGPDAILLRMLQNMEEKISSELRGEIAESGYTADEIITMASIIEKEAFGPAQMPMISSVLHNRLAIGMRLQCDVTKSYVVNVIAHFAQNPSEYEAYYDTYQCPGLPAGAICNPSLDAIRAALRPAESEYLFFVTDQAGNYYYGVTWEEHLENIEQAKAVNSRLEQPSS